MVVISCPVATYRIPGKREREIMFKVEFETSNAAFDDENDGNSREEIRRILRGISFDVYENGETGGMIRDSNGNRIGSWEYTDD